MTIPEGQYPPESLVPVQAKEIKTPVVTTTLSKQRLLAYLKSLSIVIRGGNYRGAQLSIEKLANAIQGKNEAYYNWMCERDPNEYRKTYGGGFNYGEK